MLIWLLVTLAVATVFAALLWFKILVPLGRCLQLQEELEELEDWPSPQTKCRDDPGRDKAGSMPILLRAKRPSL
jgi:hypothetical protein